MTDKVGPEKISLLRAYGAEVVVCPVAVAARGSAELLLGRRAAHRRAARRSGPTSTPTRTTRWPTRRPPGPSCGARPAGGSPTSSPAPARAARSPAPPATSRRRTRRSRSSPPTPRARCSPAARAGRTSSRASARTSSPPPGSPSCTTTSSPISDEESFLTARRVSRGEGILIGGSRRAWPSPRRSRSPSRPTPDDIVVVLNPDSGRGYLSRVFDDEWMANFGFLQRVRPVRRRRARHPRRRRPTLLYVNPDQTGAPGDRR